MCPWTVVDTVCGFYTIHLKCDVLSKIEKKKQHGATFLEKLRGLCNLMDRRSIYWKQTLRPSKCNNFESYFGFILSCIHIGIIFLGVNIRYNTALVYWLSFLLTVFHKDGCCSLPKNIQTASHQSLSMELAKTPVTAITRDHFFCWPALSSTALLQIASSFLCRRCTKQGIA